VSAALDGSTSRPTLFSYQQGTIFGIDAQQATSGTGNLAAVWSAATLGSDTSGPQSVPLLVGSDGTVYHFRTNGTIQAWASDGDLAVAPTNGTRPGNLLWTFTASPPWFSNVGVRPAIVNLAGQDTLYFCSTAGVVSLLKVQAAGFGAYLQTTAPCATADTSIVVDPNGYALVASGTALNLMSPAGAVVSQLTNSINGSQFTPSSNNLTLGNDGVAYMAAMGPGGNYQLTAVQVSPSHTLSVLWQVLGVGNTFFDSSTFTLLVPPPSGSGPGHLLADYSVSGNSGPRYWTSFNIGSTHGPATTGWPMQGGDSQHRNSLKTQ
jgi:hypothetical protein